MTGSENNNGYVRTEDVIYTLNNILDDINRMYANTDTPDASSSTENNMLGQGQQSDTVELGNATGSSAVVESTVEELDTDTDSSSSSCSTSPNPSPTSSGFTSPATSPTTSEFLIGKDGGAVTDEEDELHIAGRDIMDRDTQPPANKAGPSWLDLENLDGSLFDSITVFPRSLAADPELGFSSSGQGPGHAKDYQAEQSCVLSDQDEPTVIYETPPFPKSRLIHISEESLASGLQHMPGISPPHLTRSAPKYPPGLTPINTNPSDPPAHIPALRSPALPSTPKLEQSPEWDNTEVRGRSKKKNPETPATYLIRQRQRARMAITRAASLPEPKSLPVFKPTTDHVCSYTPAGPKSRMGAYSRRVSVAPRILNGGWWEPYRRGGVIERSVTADQRRRMWMWEEALRAERAREAVPDAEDLMPKQKSACVAGGQESEEDARIQEVEDSEIEEEPQPSAETNSAEQGEPVLPQALTQGEALLRDTVIAILGVKQSSPSATTDVSDTNSLVEKPTDQDQNTMQVYVEKGVLVPPPNDKANDVPKTTSHSNSFLRFSVPRRAATVPQPTARPNKYAPRTKSPLNQSYVAPPPVVRIHIPSVYEEVVEVARVAEVVEVSSAGRVWRKFASMIF